MRGRLEPPETSAAKQREPFPVPDQTGLGTRGVPRSGGGEAPAPGRVTDAPSSRALRACHPIHPIAHAWARGLGIDLRALESESNRDQRAAVLSWIGDAMTRGPGRIAGVGEPRPGKPRAKRICQCGNVFAARRDGILGMAHRWCRDRFCPTCVRMRQEKESALLHAYVSSLDLSCMAFVTLTQKKRHASEESAGEAISRLHESRRAVLNTKTALGRALRSVIPGGIVYTELTWSYAGKVNRDGSVVAFDGWHPHLHALVRMTSPDALEVARAWLVGAWLRRNFDGREISQKVFQLDPSRVGQVCKYPVKPFEVANLRRQREACFAMSGIRTHEAFGTCVGWRKVGQKILEEKDAADGLARHPIEMGDATLQGLKVRSGMGERVYFDTFKVQDGTGVAAVDIVAAIQRDPRTFQQILKARSAACKRGSE